VLQDIVRLHVGQSFVVSRSSFVDRRLSMIQLKNVKDHRLDNRMESFFLAETVKYLYLLFDERHFLHSNGESATEHRTSSGRND
jgi:ER degradation enhancer, mannosidase alpha-like 2